MKHALSTVIAGLFLAGCTGAIDGGTAGGPPAGDAPRPDRPGALPGSGSSGSGAPGTPGGAPPLEPAPVMAPAGIAAGVYPLRGLTRAEYLNTVRDLLGADVIGAADLPVEERGAHGFADAIVPSEAAVERYYDAASRLATEALKNPARVVPCAVDGATDACATELIKTFGQRAFRRPLDAAQLAAFQEFHRRNAANPAVKPADRFRMLIEAFLVSPEFLYRGPNLAETRRGQIVALDAWELASRLSYALWASMPDDTLLEVAAAGGLRTAADVERQARRMLKDPRAVGAFHEFAEHWVELDSWSRVEKDARAFPQFNDGLKASMRAEFDEFLRRAILEGDGKLSTLLTAPYTWADASMAKLYGITAAGTAPARLPLDGKPRAGLFTQAAFLTMHASNVGSHPIKRGQVMYAQLLCGVMPPPPADIPEPRKPAPDLTTRERYAEHGRAECARACHQLIDPLGFAFENYDAIGAFRATESGKPVDATGELRFPSGKIEKFTNAVEMVKLLAASDDVRGCMARQVLRFALGRREDRADDASLALGVAALGRGDDLRELMVATVSSPTFLHRLVPNVEVSP